MRRVWLAAGALLAGPALAQSTLPDVVVSATRFSESAAPVATDVSVITREEIEAMPALNLPDVLRARAGVDTRGLYGPLGIDATVDMRGFGATAGNNTLILVDGQRLTPIDAGSIIWSSIPKENVERIEIIRGSGSVLYGNGATGGIINVITDKSGKPQASIEATIGSYGLRGGSAHLANRIGDAYYNLQLTETDLDGYRDNSRQAQRSASGRIGMPLARGEAFVDYAAYYDRAGLPGSLSSAAFAANPRATTTPNNSQQRDGFRLRPGVAYALSDDLRLEAETAIEHQNLNANYVSFGSKAARARDTLSFTPRLRWDHGFAGMKSETVFGVDVYDGKISVNNQGYANQAAVQSSAAIYAQNVTYLSQSLSLTAGLREQTMHQNASQDAYPAYGYTAAGGSSTRSRSAWDLGLAWTQGAWRVFAKTGTTFRFANTDELYGFDPVTGMPMFAGDLRPQHGSINEAGGELRIGSTTWRATVYQLDLSDEIGYDSTAGANVNFDPTRRRGAELEASWQITPAVDARLAYTHIDARFRSGAYAGKTVPLVARDSASLQLGWDTGRYGKYSAFGRFVGARPFDSDLGNTKQAMPAYMTLDLQAAWDLKPWQLKLQALNVSDKQYARYGVYSSYKNDLFYYPADGRAIYASARYTF